MAPACAIQASEGEVYQDCKFKAMRDVNVKAEDLRHTVTSSSKRPDKMIDIHEGHNYSLS